jgi:dTDP-4-dehydrorhamnose 3,5-epimerase
MVFTRLAIQDVILVTPTVFNDDRGFFIESYHQEKFYQGGITDHFVQDNHSKSVQGTLRGLHYQLPPHAQAKLVRCTQGEIIDVAVDIRPNSPTYGQWISHHLSSDNKQMLYVPDTFAHGFYVLSDTAEVEYKCSTPYAPQFERSIKYDDPTLAIDWKLIPGLPILLSKKDEAAPKFGTD